MIPHVPHHISPPFLKSSNPESERPLYENVFLNPNVKSGFGSPSAFLVGSASGHPLAPIIMLPDSSLWNPLPKIVE